jgi:hypothetical protein
MRRHILVRLHSNENISYPCDVHAKWRMRLAEGDVNYCTYRRFLSGIRDYAIVIAYDRVNVL